MKKLIFPLIAALIPLSALLAQNITIKSPGYFKEPIRDGYALFPDSLVFPQDIQELNIPDIGMFGRIGEMGFTNIRKVTFGDVDYIPGGVLSGIPTLEEVEFNGLIGHFDCTLISNCPNLRKITFRGPVSSTGGPGFLYNNAKLDSVVFESVASKFGINAIQPSDKCPNLKEYTVSGAFVSMSDPDVAPPATIQRLQANPHLVKDMERLAEWQSQVLKARNSSWLRKYTYQSAKGLLPLLEQIKSPKASALKSAMEHAWNLGDDVKTEQEILQESPAYAMGDNPDVAFRYASPSDSILAYDRGRFNLDSIAGNGDDVSRIKNLMYWVHDNIRHDGSNGLAPGLRTLAGTYDSARRDSCGYNCRALAIALTEALLAEGIPSRYITCMPKDWEHDNDCHVICVAWSGSLNKWIWVDPTFAAYVADENGLLLHPGEVRRRLQQGLPLVLNKDANWNNEYNEDPEDYLDWYMAKNLYFLDSNTFNQPSPEFDNTREQGEFVTLVPSGMTYPNAHYNTSDEEWFWQPPTKQIGEP